MSVQHGGRTEEEEKKQGTEEALPPLFSILESCPDEG